MGTPEMSSWQKETGCCTDAHHAAHVMLPALLLLCGKELAWRFFTA